MQRGKLVGEHAQAPARRVARARPARRRGAGEHLGRRLVLVAGAERAQARARRLALDLKSCGRRARSVAMITQRPTIGSLRSSGIEIHQLERRPCARTARRRRAVTRARPARSPSPGRCARSRPRTATRSRAGSATRARPACAAHAHEELVPLVDQLERRPAAARRATPACARRGRARGRARGSSDRARRRRAASAPTRARRSTCSAPPVGAEAIGRGQPRALERERLFDGDARARRRGRAAQLHARARRAGVWSTMLVGARRRSRRRSS